VGSEMCIRDRLQAGANDSTSLGRRIVGKNFGGGIRSHFLTAQSNWYHQDRQDFIVHTLAETSAHWTLTESVNQPIARQRVSFSFGGGYHRNRFSVSVNRSVQFLLVGGYQSVTSISVMFRIGNTVANFSSTTSPLRTPLYSAYLDGYKSINGLTMPGHETHAAIGKYSFEGRCVDLNGDGV